MQLSIVLPAAAMLLSVEAATSTSSLYPGRCSKTSDCATYGSNYACVAVTSDVAGVELLNMCIPGSQVCSGSIAGLCPTFASWPSKYRAIQPVCAFVEVENCNLKHTVTTTSSSGSSSDSTATVGEATALADAFMATASSSSTTGTVECYSLNFTSGSDSVLVNGIYQCVDYAKFLSSNGGHLEDLTDALADECGYSKTAKTLCGGQGTCSPDASFSMTYECKCNSGYNSTDYCSATATSNECSSVSQCGTMGTCTSGACICDDGATGNQCSLCDPTSTAACNGHGTCSSKGVCKCSSGYTGTFCGETDSSSSSSSSSSSDSTSSTKTEDSAAASTASALGFVITAVATLMTSA